MSAGNCLKFFSRVKSFQLAEIYYHIDFSLILSVKHNYDPPSLLFNCMMIHSYIPDMFMYTVIIPLLKDKKGDISSSDNYRPIAITSVVYQSRQELRPSSIPINTRQSFQEPPHPYELPPGAHPCVACSGQAWPESR